MALLWCALNDRLTWSHWRQPVEYSGDALEILAHLKAASEWGVLPGLPNHNPRLGAPFGAHWSEYAAADDVVLLGLGQLSRVIGLGAVSNLALLLADMAAAAAFYLCARRLRCRWEWAMTGAALFAFSFQTLNRGLAHLSLVMTYTVPPILLSCWLVAASRRLNGRGADRLLFWGTAILVGIGNPYNVFLYLQLMGWAVLAQALRGARRENLRLGITAMLGTVAIFFLVNADVWLAAGHEHAPSLLARNYGGVERYALKPIDLFLPPPSHRFSLLAFWGHRYLRWSEWRGEGFDPYLGVVGAAGFLALLGTLIWRVLRGRGKLPGPALQAVWILGFSTLGGINSMIAFFFDFHLFRATNRYSIFLLDLGLMFLVLQLSRWLLSQRRWVSIGLAALVAAAGLLDQVPAHKLADRRAAAAPKFAADEILCARLESALPAQAMIFELPYVAFPESGPVNHLADYELFRPYLHTSTLRFSYGSLKGRSRNTWYREYAALPAAQLVPRLEAAGFSALYINRLGYSDGAEALLAALAQAGRADRIEDSFHHQIVVTLRPAKAPRLPLAAELTYGNGWNPPEREPTPDFRWAHGAATWAYFNPHARPLVARLALAALGPGPRTFWLAANGERILSTTISAAPAELPVLTISLQPGENRIDLDTDQDPVRTGQERHRLRSFAVKVLDFSVSAPDADSLGPRPATERWRATLRKSLFLSQPVDGSDRSPTRVSSVVCVGGGHGRSSH